MTDPLVDLEEVTVLVDIVLPFGTLQHVGIYQKQPLAGAQKYPLPIFVTADLPGNSGNSSKPGPISQRVITQHTSVLLV